MNINKLNYTTFSGYMKLRHIKEMTFTNPDDVALELSEDGIETDFRDNDALAASSLYAVSILKKLGLKLPTQIIVAGYHRKKRNIYTIATCYQNKGSKTMGRKPIKRFGIVFRKSRALKYPKLYNKLAGQCAIRSYGTNHFLNIILHEAMHSHIGQLLLDIARKEHKNYHALLSRWDNIDISPFYAEIADKVGLYGRESVAELHAVYWAKEICKCLNSNLYPKYNPFESPAIKLSSLFRNFIEKCSSGDICAAERISKKAQEKLNQNA